MESEKKLIKKITILLFTLLVIVIVCGTLFALSIMKDWGVLNLDRLVYLRIGVAVIAPTVLVGLGAILYIDSIKEKE